VNPRTGRAALRWIAFVGLLSVAGLLAGSPGTPAYVLSGLMLVLAAVAAVPVIVLLVVARLRRHG